MFIGPCIIVIVEYKTNLISLAILFNFLCTQHVSDVDISIIRSLRLLLNYHVGRFVLGSLCVGRFGVAGFEWCSCCRLQHGHYSMKCINEVILQYHVVK